MFLGSEVVLGVAGSETVAAPELLSTGIAPATNPIADPMSAVFSEKRAPFEIETEVVAPIAPPKVSLRVVPASLGFAPS